MANVISSFLVGVGLDTTEFDKGANDVESGISNITKSALQLAALAGGAFGASQLTFGFAQANDQLGKFADTFSVIPNDVAALGRALQHEGGSLESFMSQLEGIERLRASNPQQIGALFASAGIEGIDPSVILNAESATEAYKALGDIFADLSGQERLRAADVFGLDEASIRLLSKGTTQVNALADAQKKMRPVTEQMTKESARFNDEVQDLFTNIGGVADKISIALLPVISDSVGGMNDWIDVNREFIGSGINDILDPMSEYITEIAIAGGLLASGGLLGGLASMSKFVPLIGGGLATAAAAAGTIAAVGAAAAGGVAVGTVISDNLSDDVQTDIGRAITRTLAVFGNDEAQQALIAEANAGGFSGGFSTEQNALQRQLFPYLSAPLQQERERRTEAETQQSSNQRPIQVNLMLEGTVIDQRIVDVNDQLNEQALIDIQSSSKD